MTAALALLAALAVAAPAGPPPAPSRWVEDTAGFLSPQARTALDAKLESYERATGHQVIVWIGTSINGADLADWAVRTFAAWKIGRKGIDDGVAIFVLAEDRKIDIEVGYGLEDRVPDAIASRIIREVMVPKLRAGDRDGAVTGGVDAVLSAIEGKPWAGSGSAVAPAAQQERPWYEYVGAAVIGVLLIFFLIRHPTLALWLLSSWFSDRRGGPGGGGFGDGGGFGGGGGASGGGGARGGW